MAGAIADAIGVRLQELPMKPSNVLAATQASEGQAALAAGG